MPIGIVGKPVLIDKLDAEAGAKVAQWIADDHVRAQKTKEARRRKKEKRAAKKKG